MSTPESEVTFNVQLIDRTCQHMYRNGKRCGLDRYDRSGVHATLYFVRVGETPPPFHQFERSAAFDLEIRARDLQRLVTQAYPAILKTGRLGNYYGWLFRAQALGCTPEDEDQRYAAEGRCVRRYPKNKIELCGLTREEHAERAGWRFGPGHAFQIPKPTATKRDDSER